MASHANPFLLKQEIGRKLKAARESAKMNLLEAGERLEIPRSTLSRIENGRALIDVHLVRSMMDLYEYYDEDVLDLVRRARRRGWWKSYHISDRDFIALESGATRLSSFEPNLVPGLLQTADYGRALFHAGRRARSEEWIETQLDIRMIRQERLVDEERPLSMVVVVGESALRWPIGGPAVMRAQLRHLVLVTELPPVALQILPSSVVTTDAIYGAFVILDFPTGPSLVHLEHVLGPERKDKPEHVAMARLRLDHLRSLALDSEESVALIEWVADKLWAS